MPKISVIIPCHNSALFIKRCLDSVVTQTLKDIEIIIIDDGSIDNTRKIIKNYSDPRIILVLSNKNSGVAVARNIGINIATGEYLAFVDSDDWVDADFYEKLYVAARKNESDIVKARCDICKNINLKIKENKLYFFGQWWTAIYRRSLIIDNNILFPIDIISGQDFVFQRKAVILTNDVWTIDNTFYHYCKRNRNSLDSPPFFMGKIKSQLLARKYILEFSNIVHLTQSDYLIVVMYLFSEINWLLNKTNKEKSHLFICKGFIKLFDLVRYKSEFIKQIPELYEYIKNKDAEGMSSYVYKKIERNYEIGSKSTTNN